MLSCRSRCEFVILMRTTWSIGCQILAELHRIEFSETLTLNVTIEHHHFRHCVVSAVTVDALADAADWVVRSLCSCCCLLSYYCCWPHWARHHCCRYCCASNSPCCWLRLEPVWICRRANWRWPHWQHCHCHYCCSPMNWYHKIFYYRLNSCDRLAFYRCDCWWDWISVCLCIYLSVEWDWRPMRIRRPTMLTMWPNSVVAANSMDEMLRLSMTNFLPTPMIRQWVFRLEKVEKKNKLMTV